ncbi:hypothetical protein ZWY2020_050543 [Hordeum vulgare]|nr:hypothetical protein ZWY2020_050543 [Hordeum vulgare]
MLCAMMDPCWNAGGASTTGGVPEHFIDRDPACFVSLLDLLRTGELHVPVGIPERVLFREALYYGVLDRVRATRIGKLDINRIHLTASVPSGRLPTVRPAVRAAPDGGCCVTQPAAVRLYNWMVEERRPCATPVAPVRDAAYLCASTLLVRGFGMAAFSVLTGDLSHHFRLARAGQEMNRYFMVGALAFDQQQQTQIFASCRDVQGSSYNGIGIWDCITGEQSYFLHDQPGRALADGNKLQCVASTNALMAVKAFS